MIQKFNNFKNNSMSNRINESQDAETGMSEYYDNKIKELQSQKKKSLDAFGVLRFKLETQFGYTFEYDGSGLIKIITGLQTLPIEIGSIINHTLNNNNNDTYPNHRSKCNYRNSRSNYR